MKESDDKIAKVKEQAEKAGFELMADGTLKKKDVVPPAGGEKTPKEIAQEEIAAQRATDVEDARKDLVAKLANGDANKANVIEEKYNLVKGSKVITTLKEMQALMVDARKLAFSAKEDEGNGFNNLGGGGEMGAGADRTKTAGKERGKEIATAFGYQPKTKGGFDKLLFTYFNSHFKNFFMKIQLTSSRSSRERYYLVNGSQGNAAPLKSLSHCRFDGSA